ncbi:hypothetical protein BFW87_28020 [Pseudomonas fluorescens]|uniref:Uncharacterized protein n=1 Tax=Pseudomonas fluorescens TaxID=294 RepID=A0A1T2XYQ6_PSEFL|nr:hypothetical protein [Pseudomonas fluorescens]OPA84981.1 hypothetical protein BFW87_28020 [Pseudomonas fluorescens]
MSTPISVKAVPGIVPPTLPAPQVRERVNTQGLISNNTANFGINLDSTVAPQPGFEDPDAWIEFFSRNTNPNTNWVSLGVPVKVGPLLSTNPTQSNIATLFIGADPNTGAFPHGTSEYTFILYENIFDPTGIQPDRPSDQSEQSFPGPLSVDWYSPYQRLSGKDRPPALVWDNPWPVTGVTTLAQIVANGGLRFRIPPNAYGIRSGQWAPGDTSQVFAQQTTPPVKSELAPSIPHRLFPQAGDTVTYSATDLGTLNGQIVLTYFLNDLSDNQSAESFPLTINLSLVAAPIPLRPELPLAQGAGDTLINNTDYQTGVDIHIPDYVNAQLNVDTIALYIGSQGPIRLPLTTSPLIFSQQVPAIKAAINAALVAAYGNQTGPQSVVIRYDVESNGQITPSPTNTIQVDFSVPGLPNPGEPGSPNINLNKLDIIGAVSTVPNTLERSDANQLTNARITLPTTVTPEVGQHVFVVIDGVTVTPGFDISTQIAGAIINVPVTWPNWETAGNGPHKVHYFIAASATPLPTDNVNTSTDTDVTVNGAVTSPLPAPQFPQQISAQLICDSFITQPATGPQTYEGRVFVPGNANFVVGQTLFLDVRVYSPRLPAPATFSNTLTLQVRIDDSIKASGTTFLIPFSHLKQVPIGAVDVTSRTTLADGKVGEGSATSRLRTILFTVYCNRDPI